MILPIQQRVSDAVRLAVQRQFGLAEVPAFAIETPPRRALGDLAVTAAFQLARTLRKAPRAIAQELAPALGTIEGVERIVATPNIPQSVSRTAVVCPATFDGRARGGFEQRRKNHR